MKTQIHNNDSYHNNLAEENKSQLDQFIEQLNPVLRHITPHRFLWGFTAVCTFVAWNRGLMLLYGLVAFLLAVLVISHIYRLLNLSGLTLSANFISEQGVISVNKDEVFVGEPVGVKISTINHMTKHFLQVHVPVFRVLQGHQAQIQPINPAQIFILNCKGEEDFISELQLTRGVYRIQSAKVSCAYPLGLLESSKEYDLQASSVDLYVLPQWFEIASLPLQSANDTGQDELLSRTRGGHDEVMDIRPYRRGDAFKSVHWGASARQVSRGQDWVVKEYASYDIPKMIIVLNQFDLNSQSAVDVMIASALAVGEYFVRLGYQVGLYGYDGFSEELTDFWKIDVNANLQIDKLRKLAEINGLRNGQSGLQNSSYLQALQMILSNEAKANVIMSFYSHSPAQMGTSSLSLMADKNQYQVIINHNAKNTYHHRSDKSNQGAVHEYQLNPNDSLDDWKEAFA